MPELWNRMDFILKISEWNSVIKYGNSVREKIFGTAEAATGSPVEFLINDGRIILKPYYYKTDNEDREVIMYILIDVYGYSVFCNECYEDLENAKADLNAEFEQFTCEDNDIEYGKYCYQSDDGMNAWAKLHGKYRVWSIIKLS